MHCTLVVAVRVFYMCSINPSLEVLVKSDQFITFRIMKTAI